MLDDCFPPDHIREYTEKSLENLGVATVDRAEALRPLIPPGMSMPELALRWILEEPAVSTTIPGMRKSKYALANLAVSDVKRLDPKLVRQLKAHR